MPVFKLMRPTVPSIGLGSFKPGFGVRAGVWLSCRVGSDRAATFIMIVMMMIPGPATGARGQARRRRATDRVPTSDSAVSWSAQAPAGELSHHGSVMSSETVISCAIHCEQVLLTQRFKTEKQYLHFCDCFNKA